MVMKGSLSSFEEKGFLFMSLNLVSNQVSFIILNFCVW